MSCRPQSRQRHIWAYQPGPSSSKPSCAVSSPQSRQKRRNRSGGSCKIISLRRAWFDVDDQSPTTTSRRFQWLKRVPPSRPIRLSAAARPPRSRRLRSVKGKTERAIIASSCETPAPEHQSCQPDALLLLDARSGPVAPDRAIASVIGTSQPKSGRGRRRPSDQFGWLGDQDSNLDWPGQSLRNR